MKARVYVGLDTSNYTTSAAAVTTAGEVFCARRLLPVPQGERGLRQSDAVFCHVKALGGLVDEVTSQIREKYASFQVLSVGVSDAPRRVEGSYMPCFLAGVTAARTAASLLGAPLVSFSHQEGHIAAALYGAALQGKALGEEEFLAFHLSGGTTELVRVRRDGAHFQTDLCAAALDVTLGQLIDRCGVKLGLSFPAGAALDKLALRAARHRKIAVAKKEDGINLSGFENKFDQLQRQGESNEDLAGFVFDIAVEAVRALLSFERDDLPVLFSGGVSSSAYLRKAFCAPRFYFAPPAYCTDNAIGIALCAKKEME